MQEEPEKPVSPALVVHVIACPPSPVEKALAPIPWLRATIYVDGKPLDNRSRTL